MVRILEMSAFAMSSSSHAFLNNCDVAAMEPTYDALLIVGILQHPLNNSSVGLSAVQYTSHIDGGGD